MKFSDTRGIPEETAATATGGLGNLD